MELSLSKNVVMGPVDDVLNEIDKKASFYQPLIQARRMCEGEHAYSLRCHALASVCIRIYSLFVLCDTPLLRDFEEEFKIIITEWMRDNGRLDNDAEYVHDETMKRLRDLEKYIQTRLKYLGQGPTIINM